jgi:hypothetical protein
MMNDYVVCYTHLTGVFCLLEREKQHDWHVCPHHPSPIDPRWEEEIVKCPNVVRIVHEGERLQADIIDWRVSRVKMSDGTEGYFSTSAIRPMKRIKYISRKDEWFDEGTEVKLIDDYRDNDAMFYNRGLNSGLFEGLKDGKLDQEVCCFDEFDIIEVDDA